MWCRSNDLLNGNVKLIEHDDNKEKVRHAEFVKEILEIRSFTLDDFNNKMQDIIDHGSTVWELSHFILIVFTS